jgi:hypothetical protein
MKLLPKRTYCLFLFVCFQLLSSLWYQSYGVMQITNDFPIDIPSSAAGPVYYSFEFVGISWGGADCGGISYSTVWGKTVQYGTVNGNKVRDNGVVHSMSEAIYRTCIDSEPLGYNCHQSYNGMVEPAVYSPNEDQGGCPYENGYLYNQPGPTPNGECWQLVTETSSGSGWTLEYTHPAYENVPLCYYYIEKSCWPPEVGAPQCYVIVFGWSSYYKIVLTLDQGASPPTLPGLPPGAVGARTGCQNCSSSPIPTAPGGAQPGQAGLTAWWPLDGDASEPFGGNSGTVVGGGAATFTAGQVLQGLDCNGNPAGISVPDSSALNFQASADFSIEGWIKPRTATTSFGVMSIAGKRSTPVNGNNSVALGYELCLVNGKLSFQISDSTATSPLNAGGTGADLRNNAWHHVAVTVRRSLADGGKLYVDGQFIATFDPTSKAGDLTTSQPFRIGMHPSSWLDCNYRGGIDEISLHNRSLSAVDIAAIWNAGRAGQSLNQQCRPFPSGLLGWWSGEGNGADVLGTHNGSIVGGGNVSFVLSEVGQGLDLNGTPAGVSVPTHAALNFGAGADLSIEAWIKPKTATTTYGVMALASKRSTPTWGNDDVALGYELCLIDGKLAFQISDNLATYPLVVGGTGSDLRDQKWHHVAVTLQRSLANGGKLYVDGQLLSTFDPTSKQGNLSTTEPFRIGIHASGWLNCNLKGGIDEVSLYNRALSSSEILGIYKSAGFGKCLPIQ